MVRTPGVASGATGSRTGLAPLSSSAGDAAPLPTTPPLTRALRLVAFASVLGAAAVVLPNLSAQGAPHAVQLMAAETRTYRASGAARAARLARSAPGGAASLAAAGAAGVLAPIIGGPDEAASADASAVGAALVGVVGGDALGAALAAADAVARRGGDGAAVEAARDFVWAARKGGKAEEVQW